LDKEQLRRRRIELAQRLTNLTIPMQWVELQYTKQAAPEWWLAVPEWAEENVRELAEIERFGFILVDVNGLGVLQHTHGADVTFKPLGRWISCDDLGPLSSFEKIFAVQGRLCQTFHVFTRWE
jgi:hypothetical protein